MPAQLPVEIWAMVVANHDSQDRSSLLPLQIVSKRLHALVTPLLYETISITFSDVDTFIHFAMALGAQQDNIPANLAWDPQVGGISLPHISIQFHRISTLQASFTSNPSLAAYTTSLILNPFHREVHQVRRWSRIARNGWATLSAILPFFVNVHRVSVGSDSSFPIPLDILRGFPTRHQLTHLEINTSTRPDDALALFKLHPNLRFLRVPHPKRLIINNLCSYNPIGLPNLVSLQASERIWSMLCRFLPISSLTALRHLSLIGLPDPTPPIPMLNTLLSFQIWSDDQRAIDRLLQHLDAVEYVSIMALTSKGVANIDAIFSIPSTSVRYIDLESYYYGQPNTKKTPAELFEKFPKLVIVDADHFSDDEDPCVTWQILKQEKLLKLAGDLPPEILSLIVTDHVFKVNRNQLKPLFLVSRLFCHLIAPIFYECLVATVNRFADLPCTHVFHPHLPALYATFFSKPSLAKYTKTFISRISPHDPEFDMAWQDLQLILPFLTNIKRLSISPPPSSHPSLMRSLPDMKNLSHFDNYSIWEEEDVGDITRFALSLEFLSLPGLPFLPPSTVAAFVAPKLHTIQCHPKFLPLITPNRFPCIDNLVLFHSLSLKIDLDVENLYSVEFLHTWINESNMEQLDSLRFFTKIPSEHIKYIHMRGTTLEEDFSVVSRLLNRHPTLVVVDIHTFLPRPTQSRKSNISRYVRVRPGVCSSGAASERGHSVDDGFERLPWFSVQSPHVFQSWWEVPEIREDVVAARANGLAYYRRMFHKTAVESSRSIEEAIRS
ncbi:hypothetical protein ONZ45_g8928 [Pleurotus djamor]|nr:hypothetical protein ONZ45_g8928 [Pleurotus djamor]